MNINQLQAALPAEEEPLKARLQQILRGENLRSQHALLSALATDMSIDILDCAAALLYIVQHRDYSSTLFLPDKPNSLLSGVIRNESSGAANSLADIPDSEPVLLGYEIPTVKMLRYRLDIGKKHHLTVKELKKVLIEESGVDKNNINNVIIYGQYTLVELPDEMPQDIFQHLKTVEINQQKLNIKRLKSRTKKQGNNRFRRGKHRINQRSGDHSD